MRRSRLNLSALLMLVIGATGCGTATQRNVGSPNFTLTRFTRSWVSPDAKRARKILFESDLGYESVEMFSLPDLKLLGVVTGFSAPAGMCSDKKGNVYVVNQAYKFQIIELSHTGSVLRAISDFYAVPQGCAVSPINGDLAVANIEGESQPGMVSLFPGAASGYDRWLRCPSIGSYYFVGYDPHGHLFADGGVYNGKGFHLCRGTDDNDNLSEVSVQGAVLNVPGMVQWDSSGKFLAVGDQQCQGSGTSCVYKMEISNDRGTVIGATKPIGPTGKPLCDLVQGVIELGENAVLIGGDTTKGCGTREASIDIWPYPRGGSPSKSYTNPNFIDEPTGAAISVKP